MTRPFDDEVVGGPITATVWGPCPVCGAWQVEAPIGTDPAVVEEVIREHDAEDHPGALLALADVPPSPTRA